MEKYLSEYYHQIKINVPYNDHYLQGDYDSQKKLNDLLSDWLKKEKPLSYRLLNAQTLFIEEVKIFGNIWSPKIQHILHISFIKNE
ncbi:MAG: hypothetical protein KKG25_03525 [Bacteroidetes bacterium]|nr:hypothetical protein [Bacteroidota bacterium]MBU1483918.1 hypothetical protein [Bacteroidota bacterium]MBU1759228.1 hypothetical protein [Bacteroidota bacterium]MBU2266917.1 hypothetical protein [Bacteroidota bacterium]MBU2377336.1 hypothetical protein [Bacteroidota bacterium]